MDLWVFYWLNGVLGENRIAVELAYFVEASASLVFGGALCWQFLWCKADKSKVRAAILLAVLSATAAISTASVLASEIQRPRPFVALPSAHLLIPQIEDSSFPCVAAVWSAAITVVLSTVPNKKVFWFSLALSLLVGITRPILGDHWPSDMVGSLLLGAVIGLLTVMLQKPLDPIIGRVLRAVDRVQSHLFPS